MSDPTYGYTKRIIGKGFDEVLESVTEGLKSEGFGVLTEIDVKKTMKKKIDVEFRNYRILGACNPTLAHQALSAELFLGLLLPCNVIVFEEDDGTVAVSLAKPTEMFKIVENPGLQQVAVEVDAKLLRVLDRI